MSSQFEVTTALERFGSILGLPVVPKGIGMLGLWFSDFCKFRADWHKSDSVHKWRHVTHEVVMNRSLLLFWEDTL